MLVWIWKFSLNKHISCICKSAYHHLRNIARIRNIWSSISANLLIHSFSMFHPEYCRIQLSQLLKSALSERKLVVSSVVYI